MGEMGAVCVGGRIGRGGVDGKRALDAVLVPGYVCCYMI